MATTTNYSWTTPNDTDLVKDGASAIRTLGSAIDTTTKNLNPSTTLGDIEYRSSTANTNTRLPIGTNGQILGVSAGVPAWIDNDVGDITAVSAGTGISGGGTSGAITITNDMATTITASGDIVVGTGSGTYDNLPIGTTGQVLTADTTVSPYKVKWAAAGGSSFVGALAKPNANLTTSNSTWTAVSFAGTDVYDTDAFHNPSTNNSRMTIPSSKDGYYYIYGQLSWVANATGLRRIAIYKNGSLVYVSELNSGSGGAYAGITISAVLNLVATDYVELFVWQNSGGNLNIDSSDTTANYFGLVKLG